MMRGLHLLALICAISSTASAGDADSNITSNEASTKGGGGDHHQHGGEHGGEHGGGYDDGDHHQHGGGDQHKTEDPDNDSVACACPILERPQPTDKALRARWMVHTLNWGVLSSTSSRLEDEKSGTKNHAFGNIISFVDGHCGAGTGTPYFYGSEMDQSYIDAKDNNMVSLALSEAALPSVCGIDAAVEDCAVPSMGDPENPMCARLTLTGRLVNLEKESEEYAQAKKAIFDRHKVMKQWPGDHGWVISKLVIEDIWFIDFFGGTEPMKIEESYFAADLGGLEIVQSMGTGGFVAGAGGRGFTHGGGEATGQSPVVVYLSICLILALFALVVQSFRTVQESKTYQAVANGAHAMRTQSEMI
mmetsp:Transcript_10269/g.16544  ORF Transcript_10269/g.16544 Transcript_10269/m.16544 type:complete len:361 (-) Transcript_10269:70-1152(-)